ncbi:hypothetical protein C662_11128 [Thauera sp. 28]|nr:hypothetical protein C662_11128 [Thauera sp. 28]
MPVLEPWLDYALIFVILFFPPTLIRLVWRRSLPKATAIVLCVASYFPYHILFAAIGASPYTNLIMLATIANYFVYRYKTGTEARKDAVAARSKLGYEE